MKTIKLLASILVGLMFFFCGAYAAAQEISPVRVTAWAMHYGGGMVYKYQVKNLGAYPIRSFFIGFHPPTDTADGAAELTVPPYYPAGTSLWLPPSVSQSPAGWGVFLSFPEQSATFSLRWVEAGWFNSKRPKAREAGIPVPQNPPNVMPAGANWDQFSVTVPEPDYAYIRGHAYLMYGDNELTVAIEKGDTTPPTLSVTLTPVTLWPPNNKMVSVTATITVKDDYDPEPEIKLESITASETLAANDIQNAQLGTDDRQFSLTAEREGTNLAGRIYTITYSATDASGNKTTASATTIVPHNQ